MRSAFWIVFYCLWGGVVQPLHAESVSEELQKYNRSIDEAQREHDAVKLGKALSARTVIYYNNAMRDSIMIRVPQDMEKLKSFGQWDRYYEIWTYLVNTYIYYSNSKNTALREVQTMFNDALARKNDYGMGIAYYAMGNVYLNMNSLDESADAYRKGLDILLAMSPLPSVTQELFSCYGDVLNEQKRYRELEQLTVEWRRFLDVFIPEYNMSGTEQEEILLFLYDIARVQSLTGLGRYEDADRMLKEARKYVHATDDYVASIWFVAAATLRQQQGRYLEALELNTTRLGLVPAGEDKAIYLTIISQRADILSSLGRYEESSALYREMYLCKDSISSADTKSQLNELNTLFKVDELRREKERSQFRYTLIVVGLVLLGLIIFTVFRIIASRRLKKAHDQLQKTHDELLTAYDQLEETTAAKERIESDLRIARNIQMSMVPRQFPDRPDVDLFASMTPAKEVGGDLYGYYLVGDKLYFALGDVSGKGVPASLFMAQATRLFRTLAAQQLPPCEIVTDINNALSGEDNETGMFVTMFVGLADLSTGHLDFCNAGHNPPVLLRDGKPQFLEMRPNAPIGVVPELPYGGEEIEDISNCPLFVYTDGLNEAENRQHEQFTDERLLAMLEQQSFESSRQTIEMLSQAVGQHRDGAEPNDDLTMLCIKIKR